MSLNFTLYQPRTVQCTHCGAEVNIEGEEVFSTNITHNLGRMAKEADIYKCLWRPQENSYVLAEDIINLVELGLNKLKENPEYYSKFDSDNGWGTYLHFVPWVEKVLDACKEYPEAIIKVNR